MPNWSSGGGRSKRGPNCTAASSAAAPDHVASCISGMFMGLEAFEAYDPKRAARAGRLLPLCARQRPLPHLCDHQPASRPLEERGRTAAAEFSPPASSTATPSGITIRGAKMLATGAPSGQRDLRDVHSAAEPGRRKIRGLVRRPVGRAGAQDSFAQILRGGAPSVFDNPLASRFDENDAVIYFDDVQVPWERVFVDSNIEMCQTQFHATPAHVYQNYQAMIRLMVKMRFLLGIARRIAETNGISAFPPVREMLGQLAAEAAMVDALVVAMEVEGRDARRLLRPRPAHALCRAGAHAAALSEGDARAARSGGRRHDHAAVVISRLREPGIAALIDATQQSPVSGAFEKVKFYKLAWDAVGSEFGSRHTQYEMFYAGATFVTKAHSYRTYDWERCTGLVDAMLDSYSLDDELSPIQAARGLRRRP